MAKYKNPEKFKIAGDGKVRVIVEFDAGNAANDKLLMKIAQDYLAYYNASGIHKAFGYSIEVQK